MLVVLEAESTSVCQTGFEEEAEIHYKVDQEAALAPCQVIKHVFQRTARDSPDIKFLALEVRLPNIAVAVCSNIKLRGFPHACMIKEIPLFSP